MPSGLETTGVLPRFRTGLRDLGYIEGQNILIDFRWAEGNYARLAEFAAELVRLKVDLLMTHGTPGTLAAKRVTTTVPIVWPLRRPDELQSVASRAAKTGVDATAVTSDPIFVSNARRIAEITANNGFLQSASLNSRKLAA